MSPDPQARAEPLATKEPSCFLPIVFYDAQGEIGSRLAPSDLDVAKEHVEEGLILHQATSVRIIDGNDEEVWT